MNPSKPGAGTSEDSSSWATVPPSDLTGRTLGDFEVGQVLGRGGMGEVYLARQISLDRPVALKLLRAELSKNPSYMARFEAEAATAAKLNHPNIVHIYSVGQVEGRRYIAMEFVQGTNLKSLLEKKGVPELPLALALMRQTGLAVGAAGEAGLIHRDIKPENILLNTKGPLRVKVADFGLSRPATEEDRLHLTQPGTTLGTPLYMSPEQVQGQSVDHRSDLYSLGVTFYHMLAGAPPFRAETAVAMALKHVREMPTSLAVHRPDLPKELVALVMKLMAKAPADRYQSAGEMLRDLSKIKEGLQTASMPAVSAASADQRSASSSLEETQASAPAAVGSSSPSWKPGRAWIAAMATLGLIGGGVLGWLARSEDVLSASAPPPSGPPGLWLANWERVNKQPTAAAQYRFAQTRTPPTDREAAFLAVAGHFPKDSEWTYPAYIQLGRALLRQGDADHLRALSAELEAAEARSESPRVKWQHLARVIHAAEDATLGDSGEVAATLSTMNIGAMDPPLAELALEVLARASASPNLKTTDTPTLANLRRQLLGPWASPPRSSTSPGSDRVDPRPSLTPPDPIRSASSLRSVSGARSWLA